MPVRQVKPTNEAGTRPPKGQLTWVAIGGVILFVLMLFGAVVVPLYERHDGPETGPPVVNRAAVSAPTAEATLSQPDGG